MSQQIKVFSNMPSENIEVLFWVGCAGSFDQRAQKITLAFTKILQAININFAILGKEELCTGDPARRAGNEFLFQMQAYQTINILKQYQFERIVTTCPHCFNVFKNEYPAIGGNYTVLHHTEFLQELFLNGKLKIKSDSSSQGTYTYHDSCYLGRINGVYEAPRALLEQLQIELKELKRCKSKGLCCGAGGAQMFKEDEPGLKRINAERAQDIIDAEVDHVVTACPFCATMIQDGLVATNPNKNYDVLDIAEIIAQKI
ncbi:MAG: (Fe-S)-binding protein [Alphaproteobacteria bacterium]|nr:(Fe-S)-binding protein [Alphaproteobacteria bacterium]